jgi:predicted RNA polymerase sigma factor
VEIGDHLFRRESGRMVAALTRIFGVHNLPLVEDVVQDSFYRALEVWKLRGVPENPSAWLMATAKNRALDILRKERTAAKYAPALGKMLESEWTLSTTVAEIFEPQVIQDDVLRMIFTCCQPSIPEVARIALVLNLVCGFSVHETASAFLSSEVAMEKRITRAKKALARKEDLFELEDPQALAQRLPEVQKGIYLLFNEGFHGASTKAPIRQELCEEAMRLGNLLLANPRTTVPSSYALGALMALHAARLPARVDLGGHLLSLIEQDRSKWDAALIARGITLLDASATGEELTNYHVEAAIASIHAGAKSWDSTDWAAIVDLYDTLLRINPSPVVALSRAIAVGQFEGPERGLAEIRAITDSEKLERYPFYCAALAEFELKRGHEAAAREHFKAAAKLARNTMEKQFLEGRIEACG